MRARTLIAIAGGLAAAPGAAAASPVEALELRPPAVTEVAPGIGYQRAVRAGGQVVHIVRALPSPRVGLEPILPGASPVRRAPLAGAVRSQLDAGAVAGINGDFFNFAQGFPSGTLLARGELITAPEPSRSSLVVRADGVLEAARLSLSAHYQGLAGPGAPRTPLRPVVGLNRPPVRPAETLLYTPAFGAPRTPSGGARHDARVRLDAPGPLRLGEARTGTVVAAAPGGGMTIGDGHWVLTGAGAAAPRVQAELPPGRRVTVSVGVAGLPGGAPAAIGGGPLLVREGAPVVAAGEGFSAAQLGQRTARSAVGQTGTGTVLLVTAEGPAQDSPGLTVPQQAALMAALGARTAVAMDGGGSAQLAVGGTQVVPWSPTRRISTALMLTYGGVRLEPLPSRISPNGDGVDDRARMVVRSPVPGTARVTVARAPDGRPAVRLWEGRLGPGSARVALDPRRAGLPDGPYLVVARHQPDGEGPETEQRRRVVVDRTLSALTARPFVRRAGGTARPAVQIGFRLLRPARVTVRVRSAAGRPLRTLVSGRRLGRGRHSVTWDRRVRGAVLSGTVRVSVEARGPLGRTGLVRELTLRPPPRGRG